MSKKPVAITGATAEIGRATSLCLARAGYRVAAYGRNQSALDLLRPELGPDGIAEQLEVRDARHIRLGELRDSQRAGVTRDTWTDSGRLRSTPRGFDGCARAVAACSI